jgi:pimeloyl-ACP methyl ester carboxylesterase
VTPDVITLPDDRRLSWHEFGDPDGAPVLYTAGTPVSGLGGAWYDQTARASGLRWISPDKPGYGGSDYQRKRSLISWADDLAALAGHLGLDRFALAGESGGGPFTLAAAHRLAGRVGRDGVPGTAIRPDCQYLCLGSGLWRIAACLYAIANSSWPSRTSRHCPCWPVKAVAH